MKKIILFLFVIMIGSTVSAQFVVQMEVKEDIPGLCNKNGVYVLFPGFKGQKPADCPVSKDEIIKRLNTEVEFVKNHPDYNDKGMINVIVNCKGEVVQCKMDNKTQSPDLDKQIETVFNSLGSWKAAELKGKKVDSSNLFSLDIVNGKFSIK